MDPIRSAGYRMESLTTGGELPLQVAQWNSHSLERAYLVIEKSISRKNLLSSLRA
uniref:Uncharacterized protein n=1 Tax=Utricularia reniformis TaxID=192314 RepID=A0A1Y0AZR9_9LAMI|nr:hypothetical protein AEK19_MT0362 [Utricularia reniformis]ART30634.1 hypothetical protein AEK19_MT0362 [Utricularia reniformis]